ncbi:hypothetical protein VTK26DRAFT_4627 [Humicola hyalothermophila]
MRVASAASSVSSSVASAPAELKTQPLPPPASTPGELPPWDRSVEVCWTRNLSPGHRQTHYDLAFQSNVAQLLPSSAHPQPAPQNKSQNQTPTRSSYTNLPHTIRRLITTHLLASHSHSPSDPAKPILLNHPLYLRPLWPPTHFTPLPSALAPLRPYLSASRVLRADLLATLFLARRFHVVLSPLMGPRTQPLATRYLARHASAMARLTLEVDLTRLAGGHAREAGGFAAPVGAARLRGLVEGFVAAVASEREGAQQRNGGGGGGEGTGKAKGVRMGQLRVLVRRYYGVRPGGSGCEYTPREHVEEVLGPLKGLAGMVDSVTVTGVDKDFAEELVAGISSGSREGEGEMEWRCPAKEYPAVPGQRSVVDFGEGEEGGLWVVRHGEDGAYHRSSRLGETGKGECTGSLTVVDVIKGVADRTAAGTPAVVLNKKTRKEGGVTEKLTFLPRLGDKSGLFRTRSLKGLRSSGRGDGCGRKTEDMDNIPSGMVSDSETVPGLFWTRRRRGWKRRRGGSDGQGIETKRNGPGLLRSLSKRSLKRRTKVEDSEETMCTATARRRSSFDAFIGGRKGLFGQH